MSDNKLYDESALLRAVAVGNETAFRTLFEMYQRRIYTYALKVTGSSQTAEDVVQEVFLQIWIRRGKSSLIENLNAYLHKMAHHAAYKSLAKLAKEELSLLYLSEIGLNDGTGWADSADKPLLSAEVRNQIHVLVSQLTPRQREVFKLSREHGFTYEQIAQELGIGFESVKSHMAEALRFLRNELHQTYGRNYIAILVIYQLDFL